MERIIDQGSTQNPYREFVFIIPPLESAKVDYAFNYFRVLSVTGSTDLKVRFGGSGSETDFAGTGIGYNAELAFPFAIMRNADPSLTMTIRVAVGMGDITDDRLNFAAGAELPTKEVPPTSFTVGQTTLTAATATLIAAQNSNRVYLSIRAGNTDLFIGASNAVTNTNGFKISAGQTYIVPNTAAYWAYNVAGDTIFTDEGVY